MDTSPPKKLTLINILLILMVFCLAYSLMRDVQLLVDETNHLRQIEQFIRGDLRLDPMISTLPGYHLVVAVIAYLTGGEDLGDIRLINLALSVVFAVVYYALTYRTYGEYKPLKLIQTLFFPLLVPFYFLVYTDTFSLMLVLLAFTLVSARKYNAGALVGLLSLAVRQNNIIWVGMMFTYAYFELYGLQPKKAWRTLRQLPVFYVAFGAFVLFLIVNGGIAVGDAEMHPAFTLHMGNVYFILFLFFLLFLPLNAYNLRPVLNLLRSKPRILLLVLPLYVFYLLTFKNEHIYNLINTEYFLRNIVLVKVTSSLTWKTIFFIPIAYSLLSLAVTRLNAKPFYLLYPFTLLYLLPSWLVEPRYTLIPFALFILYKGELPIWLEYLTLALWMIASALLLVATSQVRYFL